MDDTAAYVESTIRSSRWHMDALRAVRDLSLSDWAIGAGFVRSAVWDRLHGYESSSPITDIDVVYFDRDDISCETENRISQQLTRALSNYPWSVRNQARMHVRNNDRPYNSTLDAISFWLETATCIALRLETDDTFSILAPHGLQDLVDMRVVPTPSGGNKIEQYQARIRAKDWRRKWPRLKFMHLD
ncbi:MAG: nucleotidyltransferase family protein [Rhodospirillaceae bacterium]|nr:nucleotidyltransferase family protein [Rhodospirillaceae bacterium]